MKKLILAMALVLMCSIAQADTVIIDPSGWSQEKQNMTTAMVVRLLYSNGITYDNLYVSLPNIDVTNPSGDISFLTTQAISDRYDVWREQQDIINAAAQEEENKRKLERASNAITGMNIDDIDSYIDTRVDSITSLAEAKVFLKQITKVIVRYLKAHER